MTDPIMPPEVLAEWLEGPMREIHLYGNVDLTDQPLLLKRIHSTIGRKQKKVYGHDYQIKMADPTKNIIEYVAANELEANQNTQTQWSFFDITFSGGARGLDLVGGYLGKVEGCRFQHQREASARFRLCLGTVIERCFFVDPHKDGLVLSTGGFPGASAANSQSNCVTLIANHFQAMGDKKDAQGNITSIGTSDVMLRNHGCANVLSIGSIFEGGRPNKMVSFQGSSTHNGLMTMLHTWIEAAPRQHVFFSEVAATLKLEGIHTQALDAFCMFKLANNQCKLVVDGLVRMPSGCWAEVTESCDINIKNSTGRVYEESFWRQPDGTTKFPAYRRFESSYRSGAPDQESGNDDPTGPVDVNILEGAIPFSNFHPTDPAIQPVSIDPTKPFAIVAKVNPNAWGGTLFALGMKQTVSGVGSGYNMLRVYSVKSNTSDLGSIRFHLRGENEINYGVQFIDNGLNPAEPHIIYLHYDSEKFTAGRISGLAREYQPVLWKPKNFTELCAGCYLWPGRPGGYDFFNGQVSGVVAYREITLNEVYQIAELLK